ncbi:MAG TPA: hypothetical protein VIH85_07790 [Solirubrobacteraceae bacterium]
MATTTQTKTGVPSFDTAFEQVRESSDQVLAAARKAGNLYLDTYEKTVDRTTELQLKLAGLTQQEWLKSLIEAQVDATRELAGSYSTTARSFLK